MTSSRFFYLTLVRHGQTEANKNLIVQGQKDVSLSDVGRSQAQRLSSHVESLGLSYDKVYSSDLERALETAQIIIGSDKKDGIIVDARLRERGYGIFEGVELHILRAAAKKAGFTEKNYSSFLPEGAESLDEVRQRIVDFCHHQLLCDSSEGDHSPPQENGISNSIETIVDASSCPPKNILLVTHGGVIREFMRFFRDSLKCQLPEGLKEPLPVTPNTGVNVFRIFYKLNSRDAFVEQNTAILLRAECLRAHDITHLIEGSSSSETQKSSTSTDNSSNDTPHTDNLRADLHLA